MRPTKTEKAQAKRHVLRELRMTKREWFDFLSEDHESNERRVRHAKHLLSVAIRAVRAVKS